MAKEYTKVKQIHREKIVQQMRSVQFPIYPTEDLDEILKQPCLFGKHVFEQVNNHLKQRIEFRTTHWSNSKSMRPIL